MGYKRNKMGIIPMLVPVHQFCVTTAASQLLLSAGDVEQNPGPVLTLETLKREVGVTDEQLDMEISESDLPSLASCFDTTVGYVEALGLSPGEQTDVKLEQQAHGTQGGMLCALKYWKRKTSGVSFRSLVITVLDMRRGEVAVELCRYISTKGKTAATTKPMKKPNTRLSAQKPLSGRTTPEHKTIVRSTGLLVKGFAPQIRTLGIAFHEKHIIGPDTYGEIIWENKRPENRAQTLVRALLYKVEISTENFAKILQIIYDCGPWTKDIISGLRDTFKLREINPSGLEFPLSEYKAVEVLGEESTQFKEVDKSAGDKFPEIKDESPEKFHCSFELPQDLTVQANLDATPSDAQRAPVATSKLWTHDVLSVYLIYDQHKLSDFGLSELIIIEWANIWHTMNGSIPAFKLTGDEDIAHIRVKFGGQAECWSKVGTDATRVSKKSDPTMILKLDGGNVDYIRHVVIHEFGHALGLLHEHQRSVFWEHAHQFIDMNKLAKDVGSRLGDYLQCPQEGVGSDYDGDSIMHYWFDKEWIYPPYNTMAGIDNDRNLSDSKRAVLKGIHKRHLNLAKRPSDKDIQFLSSCYGRRGEGQVMKVLRWLPDRLTGNQQYLLQSGPGATTEEKIPKNLASSLEKTSYIASKNVGTKSNLLPDIGTTPAEEAQVLLEDPKEGLPKDQEQNGAVGCQSIMKIGFFGTTNSGKSTTINAILGDQYLPVGPGRTTMNVVCIKHDPKCKEASLSEKAHHPGDPTTKCVLGKVEIQQALLKQNKKDRVLRISIPFLESEEICHGLQVHDIPGAAEETGTPVYEDMIKACQEMDRLVLVLSHDTYTQCKVLESIASLLSMAKAKQPAFVLLNKFDLFFDDTDDPNIPDFRKVVNEKLDIPRDNIFECSTKLAFMSRTWKVAPETVKKRDYNKWCGSVCNMKPEYQTEADQKDNQEIPLKEKVLWLSEVMEKESNIKIIEEKLLESLR